jgi:hypothetical protein
VRCVCATTTTTTSSSSVLLAASVRVRVVVIVVVVLLGRELAHCRHNTLGAVGESVHTRARLRNADHNARKVSMTGATEITTPPVTYPFAS